MELSASPWSANMGSFETEILRVEPYVDRFHFDVADGTYVPTLLFFPDLVKALRPLTKKEFDVHLIVEDPIKYIDMFAEAGVNKLIAYMEHVQKNPDFLDLVKAKNMKVGIALPLNDTVDMVKPYLDKIDQLEIIGTDPGIKGVDINPEVYDKIRIAKAEIQRRKLNVLVEADGGIRKHTVPKLFEAGVDAIVPGSLIFKEDAGEIYKWIQELSKYKFKNQVQTQI